MTKCRMGQNVAKPGTELQQHEPEGLAGWCDLLLGVMIVHQYVIVPM